MADENEESEIKINEESENVLSIELGDIIQIIAPTNEYLNDFSFHVTYVDLTKIKLINLTTFQLEQLNIDSETGLMTDESIQQILLLSRSEEKGYCRQNGLIEKTWVDIYFGGEIPAIITGQITNLEEDTIEITTFPESEVIYIDFEYKGIPETIPIEKIVKREAPHAIATSEELTEDQTYVDIISSPIDEPSITFTETGESIIKMPDSVFPDENIRDVLHSVYLDANELFGEDIGEIFQVVEIPESEKRYGIDLQLNDFTDELLSTIPNSKRTKKVMNRIHNLVERFKELRQYYSKFDENGNVISKKIFGDLHKPLVEHIFNLDRKLRWIIPVVSQQKKIYDLKVEDDDIIEDVFPLNNYNEYNNFDIIQNNFYKNNTQIGDEIKYDTYYSQINPQFTPFVPPKNREDFLLYNKEIKTDLEAIVNNLGDFYSTTIESSTTNKSILKSSSKFKYLVQRYNLGLNKIKSTEMKGGKKVFTRDLLTPNDKITIKSLIFMPEPIMKYSHVDLPGTNILMRSQLSQHKLEYYRIFRKTIDIPQKIVDNLENELDYENLEKDENIEFLSRMTEYILDDSLNNEDNKYKNFLNVIVPKIRTIIRLIRKYIKDKLSFKDVVKSLEPFMIYTDNITYGQYNEIRYFIKEKINEYKKNFAQKSNDYSIMKNINYRQQPSVNRIENILFEKKEIYDIFLENYRKQNGLSLSSSEILLNVIQLDNGLLFSNLLTFMLISLITPNKLLDSIEKPKIDSSSDDKVRSNNCVRRFLVKKYSSIAELQKDNNVEDLYYDKDLDDTPYHILKKYEEEKKKMLPDKFVSFLAENLIQKHDCPRNQAKDLAITLISGKKKVQDGEYAVVELKPTLPNGIDKSKLTEKEKGEIEIEEDIRTEYLYYRRIKDTWVKDNTIESEAFLDTNAIFCNIDLKCHKNPSVKTCDTNEQSAIRMKEISMKHALNEFDARFTITIDELTKELEKGIIKYSQNMKKNKILNDNALLKSNFIAYEIGKYANKEEIIISPFAKLRDLIFSQDDFSKKQYDICRFVENFTRAPLVSEQHEDQHWLYCKETNTKLFPYSIYELASVFVNGGDYALKQEELRHKVGTLSDDGDSIVDKYSGYVICKIDSVNEEGYDESGFKVISNDIIEKDLGTVAADILEKKKGNDKIFEDETTQIVYNIFRTISSNIDIDVETIESFVMRFSMSLITSKGVILSESSYTKRAEKIEKEKGKMQIPYKIYRNQNIITIVGCVLLVAIQTTTPPFKLKKTFPGCVRSFSGFPLDGGVEDTTGLKYVSCVIDKSKSSIEPWDSIQKLTSSIMEKRMKEILEKFILNNNEITEMYLKKREYMLLHPEEVTPDEHSISKWKHFLPPVVDYSISKSLQGTSHEFDKDFLELMKKGHREQREKLNIYKSKNIQNTYGIIENINEIVKTKGLLLKTMAKVPFLENACCNENTNNFTHPISYFINEDKTIDLFIKRSLKNEVIIQDVELLSKGRFLYNPDFTGIIYPEIPLQVFEKNVYQAFIHYCNFDNNIPIPDDLLLLCKEKPNEYNKNWSIEEKIEFLKKHGKRYSIEEFQQLMTIIHKRNRNDITHSGRVLPINMLKDFIENLEMKNSTIIEEPLRKIIGEILEYYDPKIMISEDDKTVSPFNKSMTKLRNYLIKTNEKMHIKIMDFIDKYGNLTNTEFNHLQDYMLNLTKWDLDRSIKESGLYYDDSLYTISTFIKNSIYSMTKVYPNIILNSVEHNIDHSHWGWGLHSLHIQDIKDNIKKYMNEFNKFKKDNVLTRFLLNLQNWVIDLNMFINHIPIYTPVHKDGTLFYSLFDKRTLYLLFSYCWYSTLYEFVQSTDDADLLKMDIQEFKKARRNKITEQRDESNYLDTVVDNKNDDIIEYENELIDIEISAGDKTELKKSVCSLIIIFINIEKNNKKIIDYSYPKISKRIKRTKQEEKKSITDFLENMTKDERHIEDMLKKHKMGRWNLGTQKGIFKYDADMYVKERDNNLARLYEDLQVNEIETVENVALDVNDLNRLDEIENNEQYDAEGLDFGHLDEDYQDGVYYEEDVDRDFGYDD